MIRIITHYEAKVLNDTLEDAFTLAREADDLPLMVDLARSLEIISKLKTQTIEELLGE